MLLALLDLALASPEPTSAPAPTEQTERQSPQEVQSENNDAAADNLEAGETVIIRAQRLSKPFANISFEKMDIYTNPASKADALLAVADLQFATNNNNSADIVLRGGLARLSRTYFNDVPIYEAVRGSSLLQTTHGFSIFNTSTIKSVETYSSAPPSYFANTAGGVIRILPDDDGFDSSSVEINTTRIGFNLTRQLPAKNGSFVQIYGEHRNIDPLLFTNPKLEDLVTSSRGLNFGINALIRLNEKQELRIFASNDLDDGLYPYSKFDGGLTLKNDKSRSYNIISFEQELGPARLKIDFSKTFIHEKAEIGVDVFTNTNQYTYLDANIAGRLASVPLSYRLGVTSEDIDLNSIAYFERPQIGLADSFRAASRGKYSAYYGFATYQPTNWLSVAIGGRGFFENDMNIAPTHQISASINTPSNRHKLIAAYGEYGAIILPYRSAFEGVSAAQSQQASLDYAYKNDATSFSIGIYQKIDVALGTRTKISGFDLSYGFMIGENIEISGTMARSLPYQIYNQEHQRGENHLDYLVKFKTKFGLGNGRSLNFNYTAMSGQVYSLPIGTAMDRLGDFQPIYGQRNTEQMNDFQSLDASYIQRLRLFEKMQPIFYVNINNLFDRTNQSEIRFSNNYSQHNFSNYLPRTIVFGMMFEF